jgi:hypothetical protein
MIQQFTYQVSGRFFSGSTFETELLVIAASVAEAEDEAIRCIESFESIADWSLKPVGKCSADQFELSRYQAEGPFSVSDPSVLLERG